MEPPNCACLSMVFQRRPDGITFRSYLKRLPPTMTDCAAKYMRQHGELIALNALVFVVASTALSFGTLCQPMPNKILWTPTTLLEMSYRAACGALENQEQFSQMF